MTHKEQDKLTEQRLDRMVLWTLNAYEKLPSPKKEFCEWAINFLALKRYNEREIRDILEWKKLFYKENI